MSLAEAGSPEQRHKHLEVNSGQQLGAFQSFPSKAASAVCPGMGQGCWGDRRLEAPRPWSRGEEEARESEGQAKATCALSKLPPALARRSLFKVFGSLFPGRGGTQPGVGRGHGQTGQKPKAGPLQTDSLPGAGACHQPLLPRRLCQASHLSVVPSVRARHL